MSVTISITETQIFSSLLTVLKSFGLVDSSGAAITIIRGQVNRVPTPAAADYAVMWPISRRRLATNVDTYADNIITGSITKNVLTVTSVENGIVAVGQTLYGPNITGNPVVLSQISGASSGGVGAYSLSPTSNAASGPIYCGTLAMLEAQEFSIQVDVHGPSSADNATRITTQWRSQTGVQACLNAGGIIAPFYTTDPRQLPFINDQDQWEDRWAIDLLMQANTVVTVTQQFADQLTATAEAVESLA
jgi:hypothetical protein